MNDNEQKFIYTDEQDWVRFNWRKLRWGKISIWPIITYIIYALVIIFAVTALLGKFSIGGVRIYSVQSGSMEPAIKTGSMVMIKAKSDYKINEIITYQAQGDPKKTFTHRIVEIDSSGMITTKGDANGSPDSPQVSKNQILGKALFSVPYFGYLVGFARTLPGLIILIIIPATIIVYDEILQIRDEIRKKRRKKQEGRRIKVEDIR